MEVISEIFSNSSLKQHIVNQIYLPFNVRNKALFTNSMQIQWLSLLALLKKILTCWLSLRKTYISVNNLKIIRLNSTHFTNTMNKLICPCLNSIYCSTQTTFQVRICVVFQYVANGNAMVICFLQLAIIYDPKITFPGLRTVLTPSLKQSSLWNTST